MSRISSDLKSAFDLPSGTEFITPQSCDFASENLVQYDEHTASHVTDDGQHKCLVSLINITECMLTIISEEMRF